MPLDDLGDDLDQSFDFEESDGKSTGIGFWATYAVMLKAFICTGILFLPHAFNSAGWLAALIFMIIVAFWNAFCIVLLTRVDTSAGSYSDVAGALSARAALWFRRTIDLFVILSQIGFTLTYLGVVAQNVERLYDYISNCTAPQGKAVQPIITMVMGVVLIPLCLIRFVRQLSMAAIIADVLIICGLVFIVVDCVRQIYENHHTAGLLPIHHIAQKNTFNELAIFLGTSLFVYEGITLVLPIRATMRNTKKFSIITAMTVGTVCVVSCAFAIVCVFALAPQYGPDGKSTRLVANVLLSLDQSSASFIRHAHFHFGAVQLIQILYCFAIAFTFPLMLFPATVTIETMLGWEKSWEGKKSKTDALPADTAGETSPLLEDEPLRSVASHLNASSHALLDRTTSFSQRLATVFRVHSNSPVNWKKNFLRIFTVLFLALMAYLVASKLDIIVGFIGAFCCMPLALIFPPLLHVLTRWKRLSLWVKIGDFVLIIMGACSFTASHTRFFTIVVVPVCLSSPPGRHRCDAPRCVLHHLWAN